MQNHVLILYFYLISYNLESQCDQLVNDYHIYVMKSGRINMCGLTSKTMQYVAKAIDSVVRGIPKDKVDAKV